MTSHYRTLGLSPNASTLEIKTAWRRLSLTEHPDRHPHDASAGERYRRIREARDCLVDPQARAAHDAELRRASQPASLESLFASILVGEWLRHATV